MNQQSVPVVLVTDYAWRNLDIERQTLREVGVGLVEAQTGDEKELLKLVPAVDGILTCWKPVGEKVIKRAVRCRCIGRYGIGLDNIDVSSATDAGILVTNVPSYCIEEVSDHAMALLLACARKVSTYDHAIKKGHYNLSMGVPIFRLRGKTLGLVGLGKIGVAVCSKARAFGLRLIAFDPHVSREQMEKEGVKAVSFDQLLDQSDFISIHAPLTSETQRMFDERAFKRMKNTAFLINTSRGAIVDTLALQRALDIELIAGAGLDVLPEEPPSPDDPLLGHPRILVTPHAAFYSEESLLELRFTAARQMVDVFSGKKPKFIVNPEVLVKANLRARLEEV